MTIKDRIKNALGMKKKGPTKEEIIKALPKHGQKLPLGGTTVTFNWGPKKDYIGYSWKRMDGSEGYEELSIFNPDLPKSDPKDNVAFRGVMSRRELNVVVAAEIDGQDERIEKMQKRAKK